ncbi:MULTISPECIES: DUF1651 domain-containing protein [unclassified Cyanobium]|uniref:DUF1651 domain-containing protein n=1 Tax=unclassified Cyanobium TaxID=2627006 RepID=UPI0020CCDF6E|nr:MULTISPECIES: DUF1651 domain-containing protein [unclassified Cyanobium]
MQWRAAQQTCAVEQVATASRAGPSAPPLLKTRSHMRRNDARELWLRLKALGWKQVNP